MGPRLDADDFADFGKENTAPLGEDMIRAIRDAMRSYTGAQEALMSTAKQAEKSKKDLEELLWLWKKRSGDRNFRDQFDARAWRKLETAVSSWEAALDKAKAFRAAL